MGITNWSINGKLGKNILAMLNSKVGNCTVAICKSLLTLWKYTLTYLEVKNHDVCNSPMIK